MKHVAMAGLLSFFCVAVATSGTYEDLCGLLADAGAQNLDPGRNLLLDSEGRLDVARLTPAWAVACLVAGRHTQAADRALAAVAEQVCTTGREAGSMPWTVGGPASTAASEFTAPVLAALSLLAPDTVSASTAASLSAAIQAFAKRFASAQAEGKDVRTLLLAAACAAVGRSIGNDRLMARANSLIDEWVRWVSKEGLSDGHGPTTEAYRLSALAWLRLFLADLPGSWQHAWLLTWTDLLQRLSNAPTLLAGAQQFSYRPESFDASGPLPVLLGAAFAQQVQVADTNGAWFALPFKMAVGAGLPNLSLPRPCELRYAWGTQSAFRETIYITSDYSLATMTGALNASSVPVVIGLPGRRVRPTVYLYVSDGCHATSLQRGATALVNLDFDTIGWAPRLSAWAEVVFGPRREIGRVAVLRQPWPGQPVAVDRMWPVAVETGGCYIGLVPLWAGPAEAKEATERVKPGVLQWRGEGDEAELTLRLFARQATYELPRPEDNYLVGCIVLVRSAGELSFDAFCEELRGIRYQKTVESRKWRVPEKDEGHPLLDRYKPKPKRAYHVENAMDYKLTAIIDGQSWSLTEDLYRQQILDLRIGEEVLPVAPELQFDTPLLRLPQGWQEAPVPAELASLLLPAQRR
jgi:hypothetical protein